MIASNEEQACINKAGMCIWNNADHSYEVEESSWESAMSLLTTSWAAIMCEPKQRDGG